MDDETQPQAADAPQPKSNADIVEQWFQDSFRDSVVSRDTAVYNLVHNAVADLKQRLTLKE